MTPALRLLAFLPLLAAVALLAEAATAKAPPDRLTIEGPGLAAAVEVTDARGLQEFNPWARSFVDWSAGQVAQPPAGAAYRVSFYLDSRIIFIVDYLPSAGRGLIYFPSGRDPAWEVNRGTIMTGDSDLWDPNGRWHYATAAADRTLRRALTQAGVVAELAPSPEAAGSLPLWALAGLVGAGVSLVAVAAVRHRARPG